MHIPVITFLSLARAPKFYKRDRHDFRKPPSLWLRVVLSSKNLTGTLSSSGGDPGLRAVFKPRRGRSRPEINSSNLGALRHEKLD